jgi:hypothetical protein
MYNFCRTNSRIGCNTVTFSLVPGFVEMFIVASGGNNVAKHFTQPARHDCSYVLKLMFAGCVAGQTID